MRMNITATIFTGTDDWGSRLKAGPKTDCCSSLYPKCKVNLITYEHDLRHIRDSVSIGFSNLTRTNRGR